MVVFGQKWFYSGKSDSTQAKDVTFLQTFCLFGQKWLCSGKVVLVGHNWFYSGNLL